MNETKRTPGPWRVGECRTRIEATSNKVNLWPTSVACASHDGPIGEADAAFIVRACNSYDALVEACEEMVGGDGRINHRRILEIQKHARSALTLTKGGFVTGPAQ